MVGFKTILLNGANEGLPIPESMYTGLLHGHSGLRYLLLIALIIAIVAAYRNVKSRGRLCRSCKIVRAYYNDTYRSATSDRFGAVVCVYGYPDAF